MQLNNLPLAFEHMTDKELAERIAAGDHAIFELLIRRYNRTLYRTARSILQDNAEAEDVVQDAYLSAYRAMASFRGDAKLSTWLARIVVNEAISRARKTSRRAEIIRLDVDIGIDNVRTEEGMAEESPEQPENAASRRETRQLLERKIDELPSVFRTVFVMRALEEMSIEEVSICLDIPEATVRTRFFRARALLREALSKEIDFAYEEAFSFDGMRCDRIVAGVLARLK